MGPKSPPCSPSPSDAGAHKLADISGVQPASDLSLLSLEAKKNYFNKVSTFLAVLWCSDVHYFYLHFQVLQRPDIFCGSPISRTSTNRVFVDFLQFGTFTRSYKSTDMLKLRTYMLVEVLIYMYPVFLLVSTIYYITI